MATRKKRKQRTTKLLAASALLTSVAAPYVVQAEEISNVATNPLENSNSTLASSSKVASLTTGDSSTVNVTSNDTTIVETVQTAFDKLEPGSYHIGFTASKQPTLFKLTSNLPSLLPAQVEVTENNQYRITLNINRNTSSPGHSLEFIQQEKTINYEILSHLTKNDGTIIPTTLVFTVDTLNEPIILNGISGTSSKLDTVLTFDETMITESEKSVLPVLSQIANGIYDVKIDGWKYSRQTWSAPNPESDVTILPDAQLEVIDGKYFITAEFKGVDYSAKNQSEFNYYVYKVKSIIAPWATSSLSDGVMLAYDTDTQISKFKFQVADPFSYSDIQPHRVNYNVTPAKDNGYAALYVQVQPESLKKIGEVKAPSAGNYTTNIYHKKFTTDVIVAKTANSLGNQANIQLNNDGSARITIEGLDSDVSAFKLSNLSSPYLKEELKDSSGNTYSVAFEVPSLDTPITLNFSLTDKETGVVEEITDLYIDLNDVAFKPIDELVAFKPKEPYTPFVFPYEDGEYSVDVRLLQHSKSAPVTTDSPVASNAAFENAKITVKDGEITLSGSLKPIGTFTYAANPSIETSYLSYTYEPATILRDINKETGNLSQDVSFKMNDLTGLYHFTYDLKYQKDDKAAGKATTRISVDVNSIKPYLAPEDLGVDLPYAVTPDKTDEMGEFIANYLSPYFEKPAKLKIEDGVPYAYVTVNGKMYVANADKFRYVAANGQEHPVEVVYNNGKTGQELVRTVKFPVHQKQMKLFVDSGAYGEYYLYTDFEIDESLLPETPTAPEPGDNSGETGETPTPNPGDSATTPDTGEVEQPATPANPDALEHSFTAVEVTPGIFGSVPGSFIENYLKPYFTNAQLVTVDGKKYIEMTLIGKAYGVSSFEGAEWVSSTGEKLEQVRVIRIPAAKTSTHKVNAGDYGIYDLTFNFNVTDEQLATPVAPEPGQPAPSTEDLAYTMVADPNGQMADFITGYLNPYFSNAKLVTRDGEKFVQLTLTGKAYGFTALQYIDGNGQKHDVTTISSTGEKLEQVRVIEIPLIQDAAGVSKLFVDSGELNYGAYTLFFTFQTDAQPTTPVEPEPEQPTTPVPAPETGTVEENVWFATTHSQSAAKNSVDTAIQQANIITRPDGKYAQFTITLNNNVKLETSDTYTIIEQSEDGNTLTVEVLLEGGYKAQLPFNYYPMPSMPAFVMKNTATILFAFEKPVDGTVISENKSFVITGVTDPYYTKNYTKATENITVIEKADGKYARIAIDLDQPIFSNVSNGEIVKVTEDIRVFEVKLNEANQATLNFASAGNVVHTVTYDVSDGIEDAKHDTPYEGIGSYLDVTERTDVQFIYAEDTRAELIELLNSHFTVNPYVNREGDSIALGMTLVTSADVVEIELKDGKSSVATWSDSNTSDMYTKYSGALSRNFFFELTLADGTVETVNIEAIVAGSFKKELPAAELVEENAAFTFNTGDPTTDNYMKQYIKEATIVKVGEQLFADVTLTGHTYAYTHIKFDNKLVEYASNGKLGNELVRVIRIPLDDTKKSVVSLNGGGHNNTFTFDFDPAPKVIVNTAADLTSNAQAVAFEYSSTTTWHTAAFPSNIKAASAKAVDGKVQVTLQVATEGLNSFTVKQNDATVATWNATSSLVTFTVDSLESLVFDLNKTSGNRTSSMTVNVDEVSLNPAGELPVETVVTEPEQPTNPVDPEPEQPTTPVEPKPEQPTSPININHSFTAVEVTPGIFGSVPGSFIENYLKPYFTNAQLVTIDGKKYIELTLIGKAYGVSSFEGAEWISSTGEKLEQVRVIRIPAAKSSTHRVNSGDYGIYDLTFTFDVTDEQLAPPTAPGNGGDSGQTTNPAPPTEGGTTGTTPVAPVKPTTPSNTNNAIISKPSDLKVAKNTPTPFKLNFGTATQAAIQDALALLQSMISAPTLELTNDNKFKVKLPITPKAGIKQIQVFRGTTLLGTWSAPTQTAFTRIASLVPFFANASNNMIEFTTDSLEGLTFKVIDANDNTIDATPAVEVSKEVANISTSGGGTTVSPTTPGGGAVTGNVGNVTNRESISYKMVGDPNGPMADFMTNYMNPFFSNAELVTVDGKNYIELTLTGKAYGFQNLRVTGGFKTISSEGEKMDQVRVIRFPAAKEVTIHVDSGELGYGAYDLLFTFELSEEQMKNAAAAGTGGITAVQTITPQIISEGEITFTIPAESSAIVAYAKKIASKIVDGQYEVAVTLATDTDLDTFIVTQEGKEIARWDKKAKTASLAATGNTNVLTFTTSSLEDLTFVATTKHRTIEAKVGATLPKQEIMPEVEKDGRQPITYTMVADPAGPMADFITGYLAPYFSNAVHVTEDGKEYVELTLTGKAYGFAKLQYIDADGNYVNIDVLSSTGEKLDQVRVVRLPLVQDKDGITKIFVDSGDLGYGAYTLFFKFNAPAKSGEVATVANPFKDIDGIYSKDDILALYAAGITTGTSKTAFSPNANMTRAQFAVMVARALGVSSSKETQFKDVQGKWYAAEVQALAEIGIITGVSETKFKPGEKITRQQAAVMIHRMLEHKGYTNKATAADLNFKDNAKVADYAKAALAELQAQGILTGNEGKVNPKSNLTRAQMAKILKNAADLVGLLD